MSRRETRLVRQRSEPIPDLLGVARSEGSEGDVAGSGSLDGDRVNLAFRITNQNGDRFQRSFRPTYTILDVRKKLARLLRTRLDNVSLLKDDSPLQDDLRVTTVRDSELDLLTGDFLDVDLPDRRFNDSISVTVQNEPPKRTFPTIITCKFHVVAQDHSFTKSFAASCTVSGVKESLDAILGTERDVLLLVKNGTILNNDLPLRELDIDIFGNLEVELFTKDGSKMKFDTVYKDVPIADILTVAIGVGPNKFINVNVEVIDARIKKPYLGGYRNKITGFEYHHAFTQTQDLRPRLPAEMKNHRDTQTAQVKEKAMATSMSRGTQILLPGTYIPHLTDVVLTARPYVPYVPPEKKYTPEVAAVKIQKCWRAYRCRKYVDRWLIECRQRIQAARQEELEEIRIRDIQIQKEIRAKTFPRTKDDFDQLYAMVDRWRNTEIARISKLHSKGPKVAEFGLLLDKEVQLLRSIEKFRIELAEDCRNAKEMELLNELSKSVTWRDVKGNLITMDTVEAQQARKFRELYSKFCDFTVSTDERMALLVSAKCTLANYKSPVTEQLVSLLDRECELLVRNVPAKSLEALRKRIRSTMFQFVKTSDFNKNIVEKYRKGRSRRMEDERLFGCRQCGGVKMHTEFPLDSRTENVRVCNACIWNNVSDRDWVDMTPYKFILRAVRREETKLGCCSSLAYVVQERDIFFIVHKIWHSKSAISEASDLIDLRLCRWNVVEEWSPWNCILVTFKEMKSHVKLAEPESVYAPELLRKVRNKHLLARMHFERLGDVEGKIAENPS